MLNPGKTFTANGMSLAADGIMVSSADAELSVDSPAGGTVAAVCVDLAAIGQACGDSEIADFLLSRPGSVDIVLAPALADQLRQNLMAVLQACREAQSQDELSYLEHTFLTALCAQFALHRATGYGWSKAAVLHHGGTILAAKSLLRHNRSGALNYRDISRRLGCTPRSIQSTFAVQGTPNPSQYLRAVKLNRVRRDLLDGRRNGESIGDIAARHGFWNWSRFSQYYRRQFGELPSQTKARLRTGI